MSSVKKQPGVTGMIITQPDLKRFVELLETLAEQGFIDVEPTEGEYDLTLIYDFLVTVGIAERTTDHYWLMLANEDACRMLVNILRKAQPDVLGEETEGGSKGD